MNTIITGHGSMSGMRHNHENGDRWERIDELNLIYDDRLGEFSKVDFNVIYDDRIREFSKGDLK